MVRQTVRKVTPASRTGRVVVGVIFILGGLLGFLPVLGFWMVPLGLLILSHDFPAVRRFRRNAEVRLGRWWQSRRAPKKTQQQKIRDEESKP